MTNKKIAFWDTVTEQKDIFWVNFSDHPIVLKVLDWNPKEWKYENRNWEPSLYLETDKGNLRITSKRLQRALKPFVGFQGDLLIRRQMGQSSLETYYEVKKFNKAEE